ncbi:MAG: hypothetical protein COT22_00620 [Ignavibacteria bacterium CG08_land_8_20_14_0_20_37_9]|nr:MAG: hypothetical protein AUJ54_07965 [Ignavibacteria bacterium CG1_02_37_35]PIS46305.1 MAG: hypothetical protein COT22_00620 [Ignavibacteria bacterium CG08_land_8_20_14_0_20_37_9]PIX93264.1 MAG: hypothetical protein COZ25_11485 [Ignavibacteria bacterium CG_4_10_14_3_um_filter_37_18]
MKFLFPLVVFSLLLLSVNIHAQTIVEDQGLKRFELSVEFGSGSALENNMFKTEIDKVQASPELLFNIAMHVIVDAHLSFGFILEGYSQTIRNISVTSPDGQMKNENFDFACNNVGFDGRWTFSKGIFEPYSFLCVNLVSGSLQNSDLGKLLVEGFSLGGGVGTKLNFSESWAVAIEAIGFLGTAKWQQKVFTNSTGTSFNPSSADLTLGMVYRWGEI